MSEKDNLPEADGNKVDETIEIEDIKIEIEVEDPKTSPETQEKTESINEPIVDEQDVETVNIKEDVKEVDTEEDSKVETSPEAQEKIESTNEPIVDEQDVVTVNIKKDVKEVDTEEGSKAETSTKEEKEEKEEDVSLETSSKPDSEDHAIDEIEASNAKEAESESKSETKSETTKIEEKNYPNMPMVDLVTDLEILLKTDKIHLIKNSVENIKNEFNKKFGVFLEQKKQVFLDEGGNSIDFQFNFPLKTQFNSLYKEFREKRQSYYKNLETTLKSNFDDRVEIIQEIKSLLNVEENINTTYKHFKALQERWRNAGPIPRDKYNNVWNNYHHHVENFYDFLHLNRDLRDLDFKHNLEKKQKLIARAEELAQDEDSNRAFRELQALHKLWKEELGPVAKEFREDIWERFRNATKSIHEKNVRFILEN